MTLTLSAREPILDDVYGRQFLTSEVDHRTERIRIFIMAVDP